MVENAIPKYDKNMTVKSDVVLDWYHVHIKGSRPEHGSVCDTCIAVWYRYTYFYSAAYSNG